MRTPDVLRDILVDYRTVEIGPQNLGIIAPSLPGEQTEALVTVSLTPQVFAVSAHDKNQGVAALFCTSNPALLEQALGEVGDTFKKLGLRKMVVSTLNLAPEDLDRAVIKERMDHLREAQRTLKGQGLSVQRYNLGQGPIALVTAFGGPQIASIEDHCLEKRVVPTSRGNWLATQRLITLCADGKVRPGAIPPDRYVIAYKPRSLS